MASDLHKQLYGLLFGGVLIKGGPGSGNYGHAGRPGEVGGSGPGGERQKLSHPRENTDATRLLKDAGVIPRRIGEVRFARFKHAADEVAAASRIKQVHEKIVEHHPVLKEVLQEFPVSTLEVVDSKSVGGHTRYIGTQYEYAYGLYDYTFDMIVVSRDGAENWHERGSLTVGTNVVDASPAGTYRHELGHHVWRYAGRTDVMPSMSGLAEEFKAVVPKLGREVVRGISQYATTTQSNGRLALEETFAEAFSAWTHPDYGREGTTRMHSTIEAVMEKHLPRRKP